MSAHQWSTNPSDNQTADARAQWPEGQPASSLNNSARGAMASAALWRDDHLGTLVATVNGSNVYSVSTNEGLIDPASIAGGGTAKITKPFLIRVVLPPLSVAVATAAPTIIFDGAAPVPLLRRDGSPLVDGDLTGIPVETLGDTITAGTYTRARILNTLPSNQPQVDVSAINARIESRGQAYADSAVNRSVTAGRWVLAGSKGVFDQPGTGGFISPFGGHTMHCDYWTYQFLDANNIVQCAPFGFRFRAFQVYIQNQGWVTCGAVS